MSTDRIDNFLRTARVAYSQHPLARLRRIWGRLTEDAPSDTDMSAADILLLPLVGLLLTVLLLTTVPGASDAISAACSTACMP